jgi:Leucine-rich repeat (LRR) protein
MRFDVAIKNLITQNTAIADEIAGIYPVVVPANVSAQVNPVLVYNQVSTSPISTKSQYGEYDRAVIQLSIFCKSLDKCQIIAAAIRAFLDRYSGTITVAGTDYRIDLVRFQNQEFVGFDEDNDVFMIAQDYQFAMTRFWTFGLPTLCGSVNAAQTNATLRIEDFPLLWLEGNGGAGYYDTYKGDTFEISGSGCVYGGNVSDYAAVISIVLDNKSLTTNFTDVMLSKFVSLTELVCAENSISVLNVANLTSLTSLICFSNTISTLNISNLTLLTFLACANNSISTLDVSNLTSLNYLSCAENSISILDVSSLTSLTYLHCHTNSISTLDVSNLTSLTLLACANNSINILDVSSLTSLTFLNCARNSISILDVSSLTSLTSLSCHTNSISTLDVTNLTSLITLICFSNSVSTLDLSNSTSLTYLDCRLNQITNTTNSQILVDLDNNGNSNGYFQSSIFGGGSLTTAGAAAKAALQSKGWNIVGL